MGTLVSLQLAKDVNSLCHKSRVVHTAVHVGVIQGGMMGLARICHFILGALYRYAHHVLKLDGILS